jgi:hypothetical protein
MNLRTVTILDIQCGIARTQELAICKRDVIILSAHSLNADFAGLAPPTPKHAVLHTYFLDRLLVVVNGFDGYRIVKRADKAILDRNVIRIDHVNAIGIVSPVSYDFDVVDCYVTAMEH